MYKKKKQKNSERFRHAGKNDFGIYARLAKRRRNEIPEADRSTGKAPDFAICARRARARVESIGK